MRNIGVRVLVHGTGHVGMRIQMDSAGGTQMLEILVSEARRMMSAVRRSIDVHVAMAEPGKITMELACRAVSMDADLRRIAVSSQRRQISVQSDVW